MQIVTAAFWVVIVIMRLEANANVRARARKNTFGYVVRAENQFYKAKAEIINIRRVFQLHKN